ncbi:MAG: hypothetical protein AB2417_01445 [Clostridiaceae bacterium]
MCRPVEIIEQIIKSCDELEDLFKESTAKLSLLDRMQQDVLHAIEGNNFNAYHGYLYAKKLQEIRKERRTVKKQINLIAKAKEDYINIYKLAKASKNKVAKLDSKLTYVIDNNIYKPKVLDKII